MECHCIDLYALKVTLKFFWYPKIIVPKMKHKEEDLGNTDIGGWHTSLSHRSMNVHVSVHHRSIQPPSKQTRYI